MTLTPAGFAIIPGDNYLSAEIEKQGRLDVQAEFLAQYQKYIPVGGVVVDVGASLGDTAATFAEFVGPRGIVYAFEPHGKSFDCLLHNTRTMPNVVPMYMALGLRVEGANIEPDTNNIGASRLERGDRDSRERCHVRPLDSLTFSRLDFIKIDAEGWEPLILDGAMQTIAQYRPAMLIEVNDWPLGKMGFTRKDIYSRLEAMGYTASDFDGPYGDVLALPKERA